MYVDDIIIAAPNVDKINEYKDKLTSEFKVKDKGRLKYFLSLEIEYDRNEGLLKISQERYALGILQKFNFGNCNGCVLPIDPKLKLTVDDKEIMESDKPIRELIGCLMYLMLGSRPDISYAINYFSRYQDKAGDKVWSYLKQVLIVSHKMYTNVNRNIVCKNCGIKDHLQKVCMRRNRAATNQVDEILWMHADQQKYREKFYVTVNIEKKQVRFEVDSGAAVTIVSKHFLKNNLPNIEIKKSNLQLIAYCKTTITVMGYAEVRVRYQNIIKVLRMYIVDTDREPLMGREWIRHLQVQLSNTLHSLATNTLQIILEEYERKLIANSRKMKNIQARLTLKEGAQPVLRMYSVKYFN